MIYLILNFVKIPIEFIGIYYLVILFLILYFEGSFKNEKKAKTIENELRIN